jgi:hypothetical protein
MSDLLYHLPEPESQMSENDIRGIVNNSFNNFQQSTRIQKGYVQTGGGANAGGTAVATQPTDIIFWAGATHASRATAPFRVSANGDVVMESATIDGVPVATQGYFGGDGSDGALSISSGTTTINLGGSAYVVKNYTSISITGTGKLAFSNPHANGTIIILKSQGDVTITSSTAPCIDASGMGAAGGAGGVNGTNGSAGTTSTSILDISNHHGTGGITGGAGGTAGAVYEATFANFYTKTSSILYRRSIVLSAGSGGGGGSSNGANGTGGAGGNGGGGLIIECNGALNFTTIGGISVNGAVGGAGVNGGGSSGGGGGGGASGMFIGLYKTLTANSGTITNAGGTGGAGAGTDNQCAGGGGAGSYTAAGGDGGGSGGTNNGTAGAGAGAGGGGGSQGTATGGAGGSSTSNNAFWAQNTFFA